MGFWDRKKSGKILKMAVFSLFLLFFCTRTCVYAAENQDFSREEEALGELDLKEVEMAVDQLLEEKQSMRGMIRDILKSGQAFSSEQWKAVIQQGVWDAMGIQKETCVHILVLVLLSWLYLILTLYVRIAAGAPILTKRECLTRNGKHFWQYKFRTMKPGKTIEDPDPWIPGGYFLMVSHLDELPQFFNILKGDMSVVGPYPEQVESAEHIQKKLPEFTYRQAVKAGLTGYAKVHGKYSSSKSNQLKMDFYYIQNYSFALDLSIIASTLKVLLEPSVSRRK